MHVTLTPSKQASGAGSRWLGATAKALGLGGAVLRKGRPRALIGLPLGGFGDQLLCTAVFRELRERGRRGLWAMTHNPELFEGNPDVDHVVPPGRLSHLLVRAVGGTVIMPRHSQRVPGAADDRWVPPPRHVIALACEKAGINGRVALRPYLPLSEEERQAGRLVPRQVCVMSSGLSAKNVMLNRQWAEENFRAVADGLRGEFNLVQVGAASDPPLEGVTDRRGLPFRPTAAVLSQSIMFVGQEGFLAHLARAVDCRAVVVFGGFASPEQTGYVCNENLYSPVPCAPCWTANLCDHRRRCMTMITPETVLEAARRQAGRHGSPLPVAHEDI